MSLLLKFTLILLNIFIGFVYPSPLLSGVSYQMSEKARETQVKLLHSKNPILSSEMVLHEYQYKPRGFSLKTKKLSDKKILVEFNYTSMDHYNRFIIRMRYHGDHNEYMTSKMELDQKESNKIVLIDFPLAPYILCVTLFPSMLVSSQEFPPLSTSDMCTDLTFGETTKINQHNKTGLLAPVLLLLVFLQLFFITTINKLKKSKCCTVDEQERSDNKKIVPLKRVDNTLANFNFLINFNQEYADFSDFTKKILYYDNKNFIDEDNILNLNPNTSFESDYKNFLVKRNSKTSEEITFQSDSDLSIKKPVKFTNV